MKLSGPWEERDSTMEGGAERYDMRRTPPADAGSGARGREPRPDELRQPLEAGRGEGTHPQLEPPERNQPC